MDIQIQVDAITKYKGEDKMELNKEEMRNITGGAITSAMINAISKAVNTIYELGRQTGSALRRIISGKYCSIN